MTIANLGSCILLKNLTDSNLINLEVSFLTNEQFHLEYISFHWGTGKSKKKFYSI